MTADAVAALSSKLETLDPAAPDAAPAAAPPAEGAAAAAAADGAVEEEGEGDIPKGESGAELAFSPETTTSSRTACRPSH